MSGPCAEKDTRRFGFGENWPRFCGARRCRAVIDRRALPHRGAAGRPPAGRALLTEVDRASLTHSLEVRLPLLDHCVFELAAHLPGRLKVRRDTMKWLLRQLALRRGVPRAIAERPKKGFSMPIGMWFRGSLRSWVLGVLRDPRTREHGYFVDPEVAQLLDHHMDGVRDHSSRLWNLVRLELWHRDWVDG